jgi:DNA-binding NtrC family response regulator
MASCSLVSEQRDNSLTHQRFEKDISSAQQLDNSIEIVAAIQAAHDRSVLSTLAERHRWQLEFANNAKEALKASYTRCIPVVLADRGLFGLNWENDLRTLVTNPWQPAVALVSSPSTDVFWEAVIRCGGYDILETPLHFAETKKMVQFAWVFWKQCCSPYRQRT